MAQRAVAHGQDPFIDGKGSIKYQNRRVDPTVFSIPAKSNVGASLLAKAGFQALFK
jgi:hypothetical protein